jgi:FixJ family two-component response regulator
MANLSRFIVAVVDDDYRVLESLEELLESAGHSVRPFPSAEALLEDACWSELDCLITDIGMPVVDGFQLSRLARIERPELPIVFVTGRHDPADERRAVEGFHRLFHKPFDGPALLAAVAQAVRSANRQL